MNTRSLKKQEKINSILDYGIEAFREKGYHFAGVQELADSCNLSKGSFYQYFQTKENFCRMVIERYCEQMETMLNELFSKESGSALEDLKGFYKMITEMIKDGDYQTGCLYGDLAAELGGVNETCSQALSDCMNKSGKIFQNVIRRGQLDGSIRTDLDSGTLTELVTNAFSGIILKMKVDRSPEAGHLFVNDFIGKMMAPAN